MGWISALLGTLFLLASSQLPEESLPATLATALRPVAWLALALGLIFVVIQRLTRQPSIHRSSAAAADDAQPGVTRPSVLQALGVTLGAAEVEPRFVDTIAVYPAAGDEDEEDDDDGLSVRERHWSLGVLTRMDRGNFESLCQAFFTQAGFATNAQGYGSEGGVDIWVQSRHMPEPRIVRCRHWEGRPVQVKELRDFLGVMSAQGLKHGTYVTSSSFATEASEFAKANGIQMQDGPQLLKLISHRTPEQQSALLAIAYGAQTDEH